MRRIIILVFTLLNSLSVFSQTDEIILTIGDKEISEGEFERLYRKNNQEVLDESEKKTPEEYMELFINYKLKVIEAENLGMDTLSSFVNELEQYRTKLAEPYLTNIEYSNKLTETGISEFLEQIKNNSNNDTLSQRIITPEAAILVYDNDTITFLEFANYLDQTTYNLSNENEINTLFNQFEEEKIVELENKHLEEKYPEFRYLLQEYHDGILLFNYSVDKIWNVAMNDSVGLKKYYSENKDKFMWDERFQGWVIQCKTQDEKDFIDQVFSEDDQIDKEELLDMLNSQFINTTLVEKGIFAKGDNSIVDYLVWDSPKPVGFIDGFTFIRGDKISPQPKTFEEARGQYISAYQTYLEEELIKSLRKKYKIKVNKRLVKKIEAV